MIPKFLASAFSCPSWDSVLYFSSSYILIIEVSSSFKVTHQCQNGSNFISIPQPDWTAKESGVCEVSCPSHHLTPDFPFHPDFALILFLISLASPSCKLKRGHSDEPQAPLPVTSSDSRTRQRACPTLELLPLQDRPGGFCLQFRSSGLVMASHRLFAAIPAHPEDFSFQPLQLVFFLSQQSKAAKDHD